LELKVTTTYREFNDHFLGALENATLEEYRDALVELVGDYDRHLNAWLFLAKIQEELNNITQAKEVYTKCIQLLDPKRGTMHHINNTIEGIKKFAIKYNYDDLESNCLRFQNRLAIKPKPRYEKGFSPIKVGAVKKIEKRDQIEFDNIIVEANRLRMQKKNNEAWQLFVKAEKLIDAHSASFYINMANAAVGLTDPDHSNQYTLVAVEKGLMCPVLNSEELYPLYQIQSQIFQRTEQWDKFQNSLLQMLQYAMTLRRRIFTMFGLVFAHSRMGEIQNAREYLDEILAIEPNNKLALKLLQRFTFIEHREDLELEELSDIGKEFSVDIDLSIKSEKSPMLQADIEEHKFSDPEVLEKGGIPDVGDANKLLKMADLTLEKSLNEGKEIFVHYPLYLEAAKAYSELTSGDYEESLFERSLARYASLFAGAFFDGFKRIILSRDESERDPEEIARLRDSAATYYLESLRLSLDKNMQIADEIVDNYIKLHAIYAAFKIAREIKKNHFREDFTTTAKRCLKKEDTTLVLCDAMLNIGAANPKNFNRIFTSRGILGGQAREIIFYNQPVILKGFQRLTSVELKKNISVSKKLKTFFDYRINELNQSIVDLANVANYEFTVREIDKLSTEWKKIDFKSGVYLESDKRTIEDITQIISEFKPYMERSHQEKLGIVLFLRERISGILSEIAEHPTFWKRVILESLLRTWLSSLRRLELRRTRAIQPRITVVIDPPFIVKTNDEGTLNLLLKNEGTAVASAVKSSIELIYTDGNDVICTEKASWEEDIIPGDQRRWQIVFQDKNLELLDDETLTVKVVVKTKFRDQELLFKPEYFTIGINESHALTDDDIPWHETTKVPPEMFKGRDELLDQLESHYLSSKNRIETYIIFGLTRHGKSSIHEYLAQRLLLKEVDTRLGIKKLLPFFWSFASAAASDNAKDMWSYLIGDCILRGENDRRPGLDYYLDNGLIPRTLNENKDLQRLRDRHPYRNIHLNQILSILIKEGYLPFIAIDEFTYYTEMVENHLVTPAFLQQIRELTIDDEKACFIMAGVYDLIDIIKDPKYGITSQLANTKQLQIGAIEEKYAEELIQAATPKLTFTEKAVKYIVLASNNIPFFIQMICRRCGWYAVATGRNVLGEPEVELVISTMAGERHQELPGGVSTLESEFRDTQFRPTDDERFNNAVISTVAFWSKNRSIPQFISRQEMTEQWGEHRKSESRKAGALGDIYFLPRLQESLEALVRRGVLIQRRVEDIPEYRIGVDLFRRWWCVQYPDLDSELDKLIGTQPVYK